jgi:hypothetical protein
MSGAFAAYLALKAQLAQKVQSLGADDKRFAEAEAENTKGLAALEAALRKQLGEVSFKGAKADKSHFQPETLFNEPGAGSTDAIVYDVKGMKILVTDAELVKASGKGLRKAAEEVIADDDAAFELTGELPLETPDGVGFAGYFTQDIDAAPPTTLVAATRRGSRIYVVEIEKLVPPPPSGKECDKKKWAPCYAKLFAKARGPYVEAAEAALRLIP